MTFEARVTIVCATVWTAPLRMILALGVTPSPVATKLIAPEAEAMETPVAPLIEVLPAAAFTSTSPAVLADNTIPVAPFNVNAPFAALSEAAPALAVKVKPVAPLTETALFNDCKVATPPDDCRVNAPFALLTRVVPVAVVEMVVPSAPLTVNTPLTALTTTAPFGAVSVKPVAPLTVALSFVEMSVAVPPVADTSVAPAVDWSVNVAAVVIRLERHCALVASPFVPVHVSEID